MQASLVIEDVQKDVLTWDYFAIAAGGNGGRGWRTSSEAPTAFASVDSYIDVSFRDAGAWHVNILTILQRGISVCEP